MSGMNNGNGGAVCTRTLVYNDGLGAWTVGQRDEATDKSTSNTEGSPSLRCEAGAFCFGARGGS